MVAVHPLVAEVLADLVDALEPTDDQPLQIELDGDAQIERLVERVMRRRERPSRGAAVERLQRRRLHLDEPSRIEEAPDGGDDLRSGLEDGAHLLIGDQVRVALPVARLDVLQAMPFFGWGVERLAQDREVADTERNLAGAGAEEPSSRLEEIAQIVELEEVLEGIRTHVVASQVELQLARAVTHVGEYRLALVAPADETTGHGRLGFIFAALG